MAQNKKDPKPKQEPKAERVEFESFRPGYQFSHNGVHYRFLDDRTFSVRAGQTGYIKALDAIAQSGTVWRKGQQPEGAEIEEDPRLEIPAPGAKTPYYIGVEVATRKDLLNWLSTVYTYQFGEKYSDTWLRRFVEQELNILPSMRGKRDIPRR